MKTSEFNYNLPPELIAQFPMEPRDSARMMVYNRSTQQLEHKIFSDLLQYLQAGDVLVINNTKVMPARIYGVKKGTNTKVECLLLKRVDLQTWEVLVKPGKKLPVGSEIFFSEQLSATVMKQTLEGGRVLQFVYRGVFEDILSQIGNMPLPPYIKQKLTDNNLYQTVYSKTNGSAAAPTAGLHFTHALLQQIKDKGVVIVEILLHVGLSTFRPVKADDIANHHMHSEYYSISELAAQTIRDAKEQKRRVIAVGTTSVRALESATENGTIVAKEGETNIFIYPGYRFAIVDAMITNFHLPQSTLIMLVSAFIGKEKTLELYQLAVDRRYRFFSFGDAMLLY